MKIHKIILTLILLILLSSCIPANGYLDESRGGIEEQDPITGEAFKDWIYSPVINSLRKVQYQNGYIYFEGPTYSIYKYSMYDQSVSSVCNDPLCTHGGAKASCEIGKHMVNSFYRVVGDRIIYDIVQPNSETKLAEVHSYIYNTSIMENILLDDSRVSSAGSEYIVSEEYLYFKGCRKDSKTNETYAFFRQVELSSGKAKNLFEKLGTSPDVFLLGAMNGKLYFSDRECTVTYVCDENDPENSYSEFWGACMSYIWMSENDMIFRSKDPKNKQDSSFYIYRTDFSGNVLSKARIEGDMKWGSICDGKHLYYIPFDEVPLRLSDGSPIVNQFGSAVMGNARELYCLDIDTGERSIAFTFDGDYSGLSMWPSEIGRSFYVSDGKIIVSHLSGPFLKKGADGENKTEVLTLKNGIIIIDMENGDINYIGSSGGSGRNPSIEMTEIEMNTGKEMLGK